MSKEQEKLSSRRVFVVEGVALVNKKIKTVCSEISLFVVALTSKLLMIFSIEASKRN
jgi:hypothetical protein